MSPRRLGRRSKRDDGLWSRRLLAATVAAAVTMMVAAIEAYRERPQVLAVGPVTAPEPAVEPAGG
ncbi:hypothetical protein [Micromonospora sp. NPDC048063]|uniref:hypothetical protein n=1 Tax=Micromonospora sp. NPDC048063 TaxID=3364256 RepID=UPI00371D6DBC